MNLCDDDEILPIVQADFPPCGEAAAALAESKELPAGSKVSHGDLVPHTETRDDLAPGSEKAQLVTVDITDDDDDEPMPASPVTGVQDAMCYSPSPSPILKDATVHYERGRAAEEIAAMCDKFDALRLRSASSLSMEGLAEGQDENMRPRCLDMEFDTALERKETASV